MNRTEIKDFKKFLNDRDIFMMFTQNYRQNHLTSNPPTLDAYLEKAKAESVIPLAFVYPKSIYGKDFWLAIHEEWNERLGALRATRSRQTTDVVLMFNRQRGIEVKFRPGSSSLQFNNAELASHLIALLDLDPEQMYFLLGIELLAETKDYLLFKLRRK